MQPRNAEAIVLRRRDLGENDRIVTLLTREYGKLDAVAKGAKKPGTRSSGASEPFTQVRVLLAHGRNLDIATQWEVINSYRALRHEMGMMTRALYLCDLASELTVEHEPAPSVYELLQSVLLRLSECGVSDRDAADRLVHAFECRLLAERGYGLSISVCTHCGAEVALHNDTTRLAFSAAAGGMLCSRCRYTLRDAIHVTANVLRALGSLSVCSLDEAMRLKVDPTTARRVRECLRWSIRHRCEKELKSAAMLDLARAAESRPPAGRAGGGRNTAPCS